MKKATEFIDLNKNYGINIKELPFGKIANIHVKMEGQIN